MSPTYRVYLLSHLVSECLFTFWEKNDYILKSVVGFFLFVTGGYLLVCRSW